ncbi:MAG TPA: dihydrodipicolinate synthase family protein [Burkholderiaceae bacterium]
MPELIVAAATPLRDGGRALDEGSIAAYVAFLESHGADGVFACGTTGEGVLLTIEERRLVARAYRDAVRGRLIVHAGAQSTADTVALATHAGEIGADAVAVIPPPYFVLDTDALTVHMVAAAHACAPLPFYGYAFAARSGYPLSLEVIDRIRNEADNFAGLKVSESPFDRVRPYLALDLPLYVGSEPLIPAALAAGAVGAVSGMAAAFPELVRAVVDAPDAAGQARLQAVRAALEASGQFVASVKQVLGRRGVAVSPEMRAPLRRLTDTEAEALDRAVAELELLPA